jgi:hypothetical protein
LTAYLVSLTDPNATWHSIDEVNGFAAGTGFQPGDKILFQSGQTFAGSLGLSSPDQLINMGLPSAPITIGSYDPGDLANALPAPATIYSGWGVGIQVYNAAGYHVTDLNIQGGWSATTGTGNNSDGILFDGNLGTNVVLRYVHIDHVTVSGFGAITFDENRGNGILIGNLSGIRCAYDDVSITKSVAHDDVLNGIYFRATRITNVLLDGDQVHDIYGLRNVNSGFGIHLWNLDGAVIQKCEVFNTGLWGGDATGMGGNGPGGPVGIDVAYSSHALVQYNDSHNNQDHGGGGDGDGFEFGEHTTNSIMQYNYSHDNYAVGYLLGSWLSEGGSNAHNVLRYNVSENDCRLSDNGAILIEKPYITDIDIYNNTIYLSPNISGGGWHGNDGFSAIRILRTGQAIRVYNNVFVTSGGVPTVSVGVADGKGVLFQGNDYYAANWTPGSSQPLISWGSGFFPSLDQWRIGTQYSQEYVSGTAVGTQGNPMLSNPGVAAVIDNPANPNYVSNHIEQLGTVLSAYYGSTNPFRGVDPTQVGSPQWDPFNLESLGGYLSTYWVATQDFAGHAFTWGGQSDPHTPGAFQFFSVPIQFIIVAPATTISGAPFSMTILALDQNGNVDAAYTGTAHFTTTDGDGAVVLPGDYAFTAADAGQHTFTGVTLITLGDQQIAATDLSNGIFGTTTVTVLGGDAPPGGSGQRQQISQANLSPGVAFVMAKSTGEIAADAKQTAALQSVQNFLPRAGVVGPAVPERSLSPSLVDIAGPSSQAALAVADVDGLFIALQNEDAELKLGFTAGAGDPSALLV